MSEHEQIEVLHQTAAENYLQGQFNEALDSWRKLLVLDPGDERAIEGIRLCELIVQQSSDTDYSDPAPEGEPSLAAAPPAERSDVDFDEIASMLSEPEEPEAEAEDPGWDFSAIEAAEPLADGLDLADLPALESEPPEAAEAEGLELPGLDLGAPEAEDIQSQVAELLSHASTSYDAGDLEGAMQLLDRVFVIDANNAPAAALAEAFRADIEERDDPQAGEGPAPDVVADENLESLGLEAPAAQPDLDDGTLVAAPPELMLEDGALNALEEVDQAAETEAGSPSSVSTQPSGAGRKRLLIGVAVVASLAAAAFLGFQLTGSKPSGNSLKDAAPAGIVRPAEMTPAPPSKPEAQDDLVADRSDGVVEAAPVEDPGTVLARARAAFDAGEFSRAVVAFNEALQIAPDDPAAKRGLAKAAAAYQEQREFMVKLNAATESFVLGNYRAALRAFYRLPGTEGVARFDRFKANGWYNLGVAALKSGSCNDAKSHLKEAGVLRPGDAGIAAASKYASSCTVSQGDVVWYDEVQQLAVRRLED